MCRHNKNHFIGSVYTQTNNNLASVHYYRKDLRQVLQLQWRTLSFNRHLWSSCYFFMEAHAFNYLYSTTEKKNYSSSKRLRFIEIIHIWLLICLHVYLVDDAIIGRAIGSLTCCHLSPQLVKEELIEKNSVLPLCSQCLV